MGFSYKPFDITLVLIACTAAMAVFFRLQRGHTMSWPILYWVFVVWFQLMFNGPYEMLPLCLAIGATLLVRFEFHAGVMSKVLMGIELIAFAWVIRESLASAFHWN